MKVEATEKGGEEEECLQNRVEFHKMLSLLIRMGCGDKQMQERANPRRIVSVFVLLELEKSDRKQEKIVKNLITFIFTIQINSR